MPRRVASIRGALPVAGTLLTLAAGGCGGSQPTSTAEHGPGPAAGSRPNVVVVMTDDQRTGDTAVMKTVESELAGHGVTFTDNFATYPLCCPSRTTFLTGEYAHNHRVQSNDPPGGGYPGFMRKVPPSRTLGVELQRAGYRTGYVGKFLNKFAPDSENPVPPGWDVFDGLIGVSEYMMYGYSIDLDGTTKQYGSARADYQTDVLAGLASRFLRASAASPRPFFLTFAPVAPHDDVVPPGTRDPEPAPRDAKAFSTRPPVHGPSFDRQISGEPRYLRQPPLTPAEIRSETAIYRDRLASLLAVDDAVARIMRVLRATHELRDTYIIFTSDNGYLLGEHRRTGKELPYEPSVRVPLIIRGPGIPHAERRTELTGNIDLAPTIRDIAGLPWRPGTDGISLLGTTSSAREEARPILFERAQSEGTPYAAVRTDRYAYIAYGAPGRNGPRELFDLQRDPYELHNVVRSPAYADTLQALEGLLAKLRTCRGDGCRAPAPAIPDHAG